jgi:hypothetical protein
MEPIPEPLQGRIAAEVRMHIIFCDGKAGTAYVIPLQRWENRSELSLPLGFRSRYISSRKTCLPNAKKPEPVKPFKGKPIKFSIGDVVQSRSMLQAPRQFV